MGTLAERNRTGRTYLGISWRLIYCLQASRHKIVCNSLRISFTWCHSTPLISWFLPILALEICKGILPSFHLFISLFLRVFNLWSPDIQCYLQQCRKFRRNMLCKKLLLMLKDYLELKITLIYLGLPYLMEYKRSPFCLSWILKFA